MPVPLDPHASGQDADEELTVQALLAIVQGLAAELVNVGNAVANDIRVPKDLRDEASAHISELLRELPRQVRTALGAQLRPSTPISCPGGTVV